MSRQNLWGKNLGTSSVVRPGLNLAYGSPVRLSSFEPSCQCGWIVVMYSPWASEPWAMRQSDAQRFESATVGLDPPFAVIDLDAVYSNAADLVARAQGKSIRLASKSIRSRGVIEKVLALPGFNGVLGYCLAEGNWLAETIDDVVVAYPSVENQELIRLAKSELLASRVTIMVDDVAQLNYIDSVVGHQNRNPIQVCLDLDASLRIGPIHIGVRRSPLHTPEQVAALAREVVNREGFTLVGLMSYEAQVAGVPNAVGLKSRAVKGMQRLSMSRLGERRARTSTLVKELADLRFFNGGGTGSVESTTEESAVTEIAAGSGIFAPTLFDGYSNFSLTPAAFFAQSVVRKPAPGIVTVNGGGWIASGPPSVSRVPLPVFPPGLSYIKSEFAGEVQTPLKGSMTRDLEIGGKVWFRHSKAGELCERVNDLHLISGQSIADTVSTYRGEGKCFV